MSMRFTRRRHTVRPGGMRMRSTATREVRLLAVEGTV